MICRRTEFPCGESSEGTCSKINCRKASLPGSHILHNEPDRKRGHHRSACPDQRCEPEKLHHRVAIRMSRKHVEGEPPVRPTLKYSKCDRTNKAQGSQE